MRPGRFTTILDKANAQVSHHRVLPVSGKAAAVAWLALLVVAPLAAASSATLHATYRDGATLTGHVQVDTQGASTVFANDTSAITSFELHAKRLRVTRVEAIFREVTLPTQRTGVQVGGSVATYDVTDATVLLVSGDQRGWIGAVARDDTGLLADLASLVAAAEPRLGNVQNGEADPTPLTAGFSWRGQSAAIVLDADATLTLHGGGLLKFEGLDVEIRSAENSSSVRTGITRVGPDAAAERREVWLTLAFDDASVTTSELPLLAAFRLADASWSTSLDGEGASGSATDRDGSYRLDPGRGRIAGSFRGTIAVGGGDRDPLVALDASGDLASAPSTATYVPRAAAPPGFIALVATASLIVGALVAAAIVRARRRHDRPLDAEEWRLAADVAAESGRFGDALGHIRRARELAPRSARAALDEAHYLGKMGDVQQALAAYAEAARLGEPARADYEAAVLLHQSGGSPGEIEPYLLRSLRAEPAIALEIRDLFSDGFQPSAGLIRAVDAAIGD